MAAYFAVNVRSGCENKAKEMLSQSLRAKSEERIECIYALESFTKVFQEREIIINHESGGLDQRDIHTAIVKEEIGSLITNVKKQMIRLQDCESQHEFEKQKQLREEVSELENQRHALKEQTKDIRNVLKGYMLVKTSEDTVELPNDLYHTIKDIPLVNDILSQMPIMDEEMNEFAEVIEQETEAKAEMVFHPVEETDEMLLTHANDAEAGSKQHKEYLDQLKEKQLNLVERVQKLKEQHGGLLRNAVKPFRKKGKEIIEMPLSLFQKLYTDVYRQGKHIQMSSVGFLRRFHRMISGGEEGYHVEQRA